MHLLMTGGVGLIGSTSLKPISEQGTGKLPAGMPALRRHADILCLRVLMLPKSAWRIFGFRGTLARYIREDEVRLAVARSRGITATEKLLFLSATNDNVLAPNYLKTALATARAISLLGYGWVW